MITEPGKYRMLTKSVETGEKVELDFVVKPGAAGLFVKFGAGVNPVRVSDLRADCKIIRLEVDKQ